MEVKEEGMRLRGGERIKRERGVAGSRWREGGALEGKKEIESEARRNTYISTHAYQLRG